MYSIGDLIIYSVHGICRIDDICEKTVSGSTKKYYVLHPIEDQNQLTISIPVDSDKVVMLDLLDRKEALELLKSFKCPGIKWIDNPNVRYRKYSAFINSGDRKEIVKVIKTLMERKFNEELEGKKLYKTDRKVLENVQQVFFEELAISLNTSIEKIHETVETLIKGDTKNDLVDFQ